MPRSHSPFWPVPLRAGGRPPPDPAAPVGQRWGVGATSALDYLRHDREKVEPERGQAHPVASGRERRVR